MNSTKLCCGCQQEKQVDEFYRNKNMSSGRQPRCKKCMRLSYTLSRNKKKEHYNNVRKCRNAQILERYNKWKQEQGCQFCSENDPCCLDLHHLNPAEKDVEVSNLLRFSWKTIMKEAAKCIVVCSNCHRKIHAGKNWSG